MPSPNSDHIDLSETITSAWPWPKRVWRRALSGLFCLPDTGLIGLTPLRTHVLVCGYPRAGSTMLQLMLEHAYPHAKRFPREMRGDRAATLCLRNHACLISKQPGDILKLHRLRNHYKTRPAALRPIVLVRDPRDVLTSHHANSPTRRYFLPIDKWIEYDRHVRLHADDPEVLLLRYEDLVCDLASVQARLEEFIGEPIVRSMSDFHSAGRDDFRDLPALNGLRPVDTKTVGRWRDPKHIQRIADVLDRVPEFPRRLIELGFEQDSNWVSEIGSAVRQAAA